MPSVTAEGLNAGEVKRLTDIREENRPGRVK
jgi:hypothetical protein